MSFTHPSFIRLFSVHKPFGVRGWVKASPLPFSIPVPLELFLSPSKMMTSSEDVAVVQLEHCLQRPGFSLIKLDLLHSPEEAIQFKGFYLFADRKCMPSLHEGEYYEEDLLGVPVYNGNGCYCGSVCEIFEQPAHVLLSIQIPGKESSTVIVPFVDAWVAEVDLAIPKIIVPHFDLLS